MDRCAAEADADSEEEDVAEDERKQQAAPPPRRGQPRAARRAALLRVDVDAHGEAIDNEANAARARALAREMRPPSRCKHQRRHRHLTCAQHAGLPAKFGPAAVNANGAGVTGIGTECSATLRTTNAKCTAPRLPGFLTCGRHKRKAADFDADGTNGRHTNTGWIAIAQDRPRWKEMTRAFCHIPKPE